MHPSVLFTAPTMDAYCPSGHSDAVQDVTAPPVEYEPTAHAVHPSTLDVDPVKVAYWPVRHDINVQDVALPPVD